MARHSLIPFNFRKDLEPFNWLRREVDSLFDNFWRSPSLQPQLSLYERELSLTPDIDISETDNEFTVVADLPGLEKKDINVEINNNILKISGEKKLDREEKGKNFHRIERVSGSFNRSIQLPNLINEHNVQASFKNGVLTITLPKSAEAKTKAKHIEVKKG
jgi:HSP20 family protein